MLELINRYSISEIIIFVILLSFAIKELVTFSDWSKDRLRRGYDKDFESDKQHEKLQKEIDDLNKLYEERKKMDETFANIDRTFEKINEQITMLIKSDKENTKSYIVREHHFFVYSQKWIDDYSLECLEKRFSIYQKEHGNSFVAGLMDEVRTLPKQPPESEMNKYVKTKEYIKNEEH